MNVSELKRKQPTIAAVAAAITLALAGGVQAQEPTRENANRPAADQSAQIARSDSGMQTLERYLQSKSLRVSQLVGMELQARNGDNLGEVEDVLRGGAPGQEMRLVVQVGGLGVEERLIAIPFDEVQISADGDELYSNRTRDQLLAAPAVQLERRAAANTSPAQRSAAEADRTDRTAPGSAEQRGGAAGSMADQRIGDLVGAEVIGSTGDQVGEIGDIVISTAGADSVRAVIQAGGVLGIGEKRVALPLGQVAVERSPDGEPTVRVAMDADALQRLPEFKYEEQTTAL